jgi:hypothetical protein
MKVARLLGFLVVAFVAAPFAHADGGPVNMVFTGVNGVNDGHFYVSPYTGTMNGQDVVLFCDDIANEVTFNQAWPANVTNLGTALSTPNGFSDTRYGGLLNSGTLYQEAAWLTTQFASNQGDYVNLQYALWNLMNPGGAPTNSDEQNWLTLAGLNYSSIDPSSFSIVTNIAPVYATGQVQEFIVNTPEPGVLALLLCGLLLIAVVLQRGVRATA